MTMRASRQGSFDFNNVTQMKQVTLNQGSDTETGTDTTNINQG
jgi:hypothetical protein